MKHSESLKKALDERKNGAVNTTEKGTINRGKEYAALFKADDIFRRRLFIAKKKQILKELYGA